MTDPVTSAPVATRPASPAPAAPPPRLLAFEDQPPLDDSTRDPGAEPVVLLDARGRPSGAVAKARVHHRATPLHLAFSCHVVAPSGRVLLTRRAAGKQTWPATWTNACCGHPRPGETLRHAVERRLRDELGLVPRRLVLAVPDFVYRAAMDEGTVEHELCPVVVAEVDRAPRPDPDEVDDVAWLTWEEVRARATADPGSLSPWSVEQIALLADMAPSPLALLDASSDGRGPAATGLDRPAGIRAVPGAAPEEGPDDPVAAVRGPVERIVDRFLADRLADVADLDPAAAAVGAEVRHLAAAGGKRLRPAFAYWGHRATGAAHDDGVLVAAAALELLHTFALLHDDVMDRSAARRGRPTAHRSLADLHRRDGLGGDDGWFGVSGGGPGRRSRLPVVDRAAGRRTAVARGAGPGPPGLRPAVHRGDRRPVPRPAAHRGGRTGRRRRRRTARPPGRAAEVGPLHGDPTAPARCRAGRARGGRPGARRRSRHLRGRRRPGVPAPRRRAGAVRRARRHRQEPPRRPARGEAHAAGRAGPAPRVRPRPPRPRAGARRPRPRRGRAPSAAARSWRRRGRWRRSRR